MRALTMAFVFSCGALLSFWGPARAVQVRNVDRDGRAIQLDGFLLEWKKSDAAYLAKDSLWLYDVINTREGLTGYFATGKKASCGLWKFRFLPHRLSPYSSMEMQASLDSLRPFYRTAPLAGAVQGGIAAEWVVPWDSIWHDSTGTYQVGLFAFDTCGDTVQPTIFAGRVYHPKPAPWGGVYLKLVLLGGMMIVLYYLQRRARKRKKLGHRRALSGTDGTPPIDD
jgi:hypothetical protein